eukprot:Unigene4797_Nuclearia_a/m.14666 Unigene4797_Nuclearia_a/g.14666  ORF Unigene4797_Nuclearia_a/g.14666 Unigene4797_Nuclearia_a/m.14666 type:complete len:410 (+) Unigene4797_Nuclearia_a:40-1269(+)
MYVQRVTSAVKQRQGELLAALVRVSGYVPQGGSPLAAPAIASDTWRRAHELAANEAQVAELCQARLVSPWDELVMAHMRAMLAIQRRQWGDAYAHQAQLLAVFSRIMVEQDRWLLPALASIIADLRLLADLADKELRSQGRPADRMTDVAQALNTVFKTCMSDRAPMHESKKLGALNVVNNLFKVYFRLRQLRLCVNLVRSVHMAGFPDMDQFPASHIVTYRFYQGLLSFYDEHYGKAAEEMRAVLHRCHREAKHNRRLVLSYLVPMRVLEGTMVHEDRLKRYGLAVYAPMLRAVRQGRVGRFVQELDVLETPLQRRGLYFVFERLRLIAYRNLFKRALTIVKTHKLSLATLLTCLHVAGLADATTDDLECVLAVLIDRGFIKGYIAHDKGFLVVSQTNAFPPLTGISS